MGGRIFTHFFGNSAFYAIFLVDGQLHLIGMLCCKLSQLVHPRIISRIVRAGFLCIAEIDDGLALVGTIGALRRLVDGTHFFISFQSNNTAFFDGPSGVRLHA